MLNRISVNFILKSLITSLMSIIIIALAVGAWDSWRRLGAVSRIGAVAEATSHMFTALHNLRVDRASTTRDLNTDKQLTDITQQLKDVRAADLPALKSAVVVLDTIDFPERQTAVADLDRRVKKLAALHEESVAAIRQPKASRRAGISKEYFDETTALIETLDRLSSRLTRLVKLEDAFIDQLLELKQLGWIVRNAGGDASVMISNTLSGMALPPEPLLKYTANVAKVDTAWGSLEELASGLPLPDSCADVVIMSELIEHLVDTDAAVDEARRGERPGRARQAVGGEGAGCGGHEAAQCRHALKAATLDEAKRGVDDRLGGEPVDVAVL